MPFHRENATFAYLQGLVQRSPSLSSVSNHKPKGKIGHTLEEHLYAAKIRLQLDFCRLRQLWSPLSNKIGCTL